MAVEKKTTVVAEMIHIQLCSVSNICF